MDLPRPGRLPARPSAVRALAGGLLAALAVAALPCAFAMGQTVTLHTGGQDVRIAVGDAATLPAGFPADVALPRAFALLKVERSDTTTTLEGTAPGDVDSAAAELCARMQSDGWSAADVAPPASGRALAWEKDRRAVTAWLQPAAADADADAGVRLQLKLLPRR